MKTYFAGMNQYMGTISEMDVMKDLKAINRVDQAYKFCRCDMCGYPRPDITEQDSFKMYYVELPSGDCKDMSEDEKEFIRLYGGYPEKPIPICEDCLKELIRLFLSEFSERNNLTEYETNYSRKERVNAFLNWFSRKYWEYSYMANTNRDIYNTKKAKETHNFLSAFFADCEKSASEIDREGIA